MTHDDSFDRGVGCSHPGCCGFAERDQRLGEIAEREQRATKGPWRAIDGGVEGEEPSDRHRCDGIRLGYHNHHEDESCREYPDCPFRSEIVTTDSGYYGPNMPDAEFIAHAREDIPWLLAEVKRLEDALESY